MACQAMAGIHADIIGFAEANHDTSKQTVKQTMEKIAHRYFNHNKLIMASSNRQVRRTYKPGGTLMMTVMNTVTMIRETTRDRMGRWVSTSYQGKQHTITVIMAYQVCQGRRTGNNTAANQQDEFLQLQEKHASLEDKFHNVTAELGELKAILQQILEQGRNQNQSEPPSKKQAMFETPQRSDRRSKRAEDTMDTEHESATNDSIAGRNQPIQE